MQARSEYKKVVLGGSLRVPKKTLLRQTLMMKRGQGQEVQADRDDQQQSPACSVDTQYRIRINMTWSAWLGVETSDSSMLL